MGKAKSYSPLAVCLPTFAVCCLFFKSVLFNITFCPNMALSSRIFTVVLFLMYAFAGLAQSRYHFSTLTQDQGLSSDYVWSMCQDKYGFMWIGTVNGVNRFDGHGIRKYAHDPKDSFSIPPGAVFWIHRDEAGDLWFACGA